MLEKNKTYKTYGRWDALVIWLFAKISENHTGPHCVAIHKPGTLEEHIVHHTEKGIAYSLFSLNEPPTFGEHHPADLVL